MTAQGDELDARSTGETERVAGRRTRLVGSVHLFLAGAVGAVCGVTLLWLVATGELVPTLIEWLPAVLAETALIASGGWLTHAPTLGTVYAAWLVGLGAVQVSLALDASRGQQWRRCVLASVAGVSNPLVAPLAGIAAVLLVLSRHEFDR